MIAQKKNFAITIKNVLHVKDVLHVYLVLILIVGIVNKKLILQMKNVNTENCSKVKQLEYLKIIKNRNLLYNGITTYKIKLFNPNI